MSYGIKVKNPCPQAARIEVLLGKKVVKIVQVSPGTNSFIELDEPGDYDVKSYLLNPFNTAEELGEAGFKVVDHQDVEPPKAKPFSLANVENLSDRHWRTVVHKDVKKGTILRLLTIEVQNVMQIEYRLKIGEALTPVEGILTFDDLILTGGQGFSVQAQSRQGVEATASARVSGEVTILHKPVGEQTPKALLIDEEIEEEPVRSLADMMKDLEKEEVLP